MKNERISKCKQNKYEKMYKKYIENGHPGCMINKTARAHNEVICKKESDMLYIGIDLGTSSVKLLLMDAAGNVKNIVQESILFISRIRAGRNRNRKTGTKDDAGVKRTFGRFSERRSCRNQFWRSDAWTGNS